MRRLCAIAWLGLGLAACGGNSEVLYPQPPPAQTSTNARNGDGTTAPALKPPRLNLVGLRAALCPAAAFEDDSPPFVEVIKAGPVLDAHGQPVSFLGTRVWREGRKYDVITGHPSHVAAVVKGSGMQVAVWLPRTDLQAWLVDGAFVRPVGKTPAKDVWAFVPIHSRVMSGDRSGKQTRVTVQRARSVIGSFDGTVPSSAVDEIKDPDREAVTRVPKPPKSTPDFMLKKNVAKSIQFYTSADGGPPWIEVKSNQFHPHFYNRRTRGTRTLVRHDIEDGITISAWVDNAILAPYKLISPGGGGGGVGYGTGRGGYGVGHSSDPRRVVPAGTLLSTRADGPATGVTTRKKILAKGKNSFTMKTAWGDLAIVPLRDGTGFRPCDR